MIAVNTTTGFQVNSEETIADFVAGIQELGHTPYGFLESVQKNKGLNPHLELTCDAHKQFVGFCLFFKVTPGNAHEIEQSLKQKALPDYEFVKDGEKDPTIEQVVNLFIKGSGHNVEDIFTLNFKPADQIPEYSNAVREIIRFKNRTPLSMVQDEQATDVAIAKIDEAVAKFDASLAKSEEPKKSEIKYIDRVVFKKSIEEAFDSLVEEYDLQNVADRIEIHLKNKSGLLDEPIIEDGHGGTPMLWGTEFEMRTKVPPPEMFELKRRPVSSPRVPRTPVLAK